MSGGGWDPIAHEDIDEPEKPAKSKPSEPPNKDKPTAIEGTPIPMAMHLFIPPDAIAAICSLAGTQERIASAMEKQTKAIDALVKALSKPAE